MRRRPPSLLLWVGLVAACVPASASPSEAPTGSAAASAPASVAPAGPSAHLLGDGPVLDGPHVGADYILPGALTWANEAYHLWGRTFTEEEGHPSRGVYATSTDAMIWTVADGDPFASIGLDLFDPGPIPSTVLLEPDGSWLMYLWGLPTEGTAVFYRATAPAPEGPWVADPEPVLTPTSGEWDGGGIDFPSVIRTDEGYLMLYSAWRLSEPNSNTVGMATSLDGIEWIKSAGPVIEPGLCGEFDARSIATPRLRDAGDGWYLLYNGLSDDLNAGAAVGIAWTPDLRTWSCANAAPALVHTEIPGSEGIHSIAVAADARGPELLVESLEPGRSELWLADLSMPAP